MTADAGASRAASHPLGFALSAMNGALLPPPGRRADLAQRTFAGAAADSRLVAPGQIFFALSGAEVDGFSFCGAAAAAGAAAVVVDAGRGVPAGCEGTAVIAVRDPRAALGDLARAARARFAGRVVGVTGSNGKTTTKELIAAALAPAGAVLRTPGNFNTEVGLPLTILSAGGDEAFWVLEMAMRGRGEIALLAAIARPQVGVITNVAGAHLERLGTLQEVAHAKGELFHGLQDDGIAVLPGGDPLIEAEAASARIPDQRRLRFDGGRRSPANAVQILEVIPAGPAGALVRYAVRHQPVVVRLPLAGAHNARNGAAALAVALAIGVPVLEAARALETLALPPHRSAVVTAGGRNILDDCYNANPASMSAALAAVAASASGGGRAFAILGDMRELGPDSEALHRQVGAEAAARLRGLCAVGPLGAAIADGARAAGADAARVVTAASPEEAARVVAGWTRPGDWILVKASRGMKLERAVEALVGQLDAWPASAARSTAAPAPEPRKDPTR
jgi:UDP-N-acetylmuramoyl-tripeptide--D-alanyl-D-alanine ligase